ncbi:MAG: GNAT family N-acetyltransferase [Lysobacterales bacterium]
MSITSRIVTDFSTIAEQDWCRLDDADNPFLSHAFLAGLETTGSISAETGWQPWHLALYDGDGLLAFAPTYVKSHSHGEFVFDWAWADAYRRHGLDYYPKLLTAVPYSPITGPRLLVREGANRPEVLRRRLAEMAMGECDRRGFSSWHCNFTGTPESEALEQTDLLQRSDWQFHWRNRDYRSFDDFLGTLRSRKRKNIRKERRQVEEAGIRFEWLRGAELAGDTLDFIHRCYKGTFRAYGNHPALRKSFFAWLAQRLPDGLQVAIARLQDRPVAMSLYLSGGGRLYGRYWGSEVEIPGLHFETAYYQGIDHCIREGIEVFESGAQGEHKIARGFVPVRTRSFHYVRDETFRQAIAAHLEREHLWLDEYREQLDAHDPYREPSA